MRKLSSALLGALMTLSVPAFAQIAGTVTYSGTESGQIIVEAFTENDAAFEKLTTSMVNPGPFSFPAPEAGSYTVVAFIDSNDSGSLDSGETWVEAGAPVVVPPGASNLALDLDRFVAPGDSEEDAGDGGCCATVRADARPPLALLALVGLTAWLRRRRF